MQAHGKTDVLVACSVFCLFAYTCDGPIAKTVGPAEGRDLPSSKSGAVQHIVVLPLYIWRLEKQLGSICAVVSYARLIRPSWR